MNKQKDKPTVGTRGLVTLAYLKARMDQGEDHLGIFMPLVVDVLPKVANRHFTSVEVRNVIETIHAVKMPETIVATLLQRATRLGLLKREYGRFRTSAGPLTRSNIAGQKAQLAKSQERFAKAFISHAKSRSVLIDSVDSALQLTLAFIGEQQISLLLENSDHQLKSSSIDPSQYALMAEFIHDVARSDPASNAVLRSIMQGLVLYHAAFLPDLASIERKFANLDVVFDSVVVRQALGFEGSSAETLMNETIARLLANGVRCIMFDKSVHEIQRILSVYQEKLVSHTGRLSLKQNPMTRHFLTRAYSASDIQEILALIETRISEAGIRVVGAPIHRKEFTRNELRLAKRLADPQTDDLAEPRVLHDVDCVAGVLTLRRGFRTASIEDARCVFATTSPLVIQNVRKWWEIDERETGVCPVVNIGALANLAWLKKPSISGDLQLDELVALCAVAMRPSEKTWERFLRHLDKLHTSQRLSEDEVDALVASSLADQSLRDVELTQGGQEDYDTGTLDEAIERVESDYRWKFDSQVRAVVEQYERKMADERTATRERLRTANVAAASSTNELKRRDQLLTVRADRMARRVVGVLYWLVVAIVVLGSTATLLNFTFRGGWIGIVGGGSVLLLAALELFGVLRPLRAARCKLRASLKHFFVRWLKASPEGQVSTGD